MRAQLASLRRKFLLVHVVLECLASVDENDRNLVVELAAKLESRSTSTSCQVKPRDERAWRGSL